MNDYYGIAFTILVSVTFILTIIILMWHINYVSAKEGSRCYVKNKSNDKVYVIAKDKKDNPMYKIKYDFNDMSSRVICACTPGSVINKFEDLKVRRLDTFEDMNVNKTCSCRQKFDLLDKLNIYYYGTPGVVRYMQTTDDSVFDTAYTE